MCKKCFCFGNQDQFFSYLCDHPNSELLRLYLNDAYKVRHFKSFKIFCFENFNVRIYYSKDVSVKV